MKIVFVITFLRVSIDLILAKPFSEEKSFSDDRSHCPESNEELELTRDNVNADFARPRPRFDSRFDFNKKRSVSIASDLLDSQNLEKRQVGVVYRDDKPIGILQPYQRSYRFIPVKEENAYESGLNLQELSSYNSANGVVDKRSVDVDLSEENYPSILANFKIDNKLDKKRNYDALTDSNVQDLKSTIRRLRSNSNNEQFEEELKNILDDMGLIEDDELHANKREISENEQESEEEGVTEDKSNDERAKREDPCTNNEKTSDQNSASGNNLMTIEEKNEVKNDPIRLFNNNAKREDAEQVKENSRKKRQKENSNVKQGSDLVEGLKESGDLMISGNKSPLAASSEVINTRETTNSGEKDEQYDEKRVEREIQEKINNLKEEVKREIATLRKQKEENDEKRKKRHSTENLSDEETPAVDPVMNPSESEMKPLIRKRRSTDENYFESNTQVDNEELNKVIRKKREKNPMHDLHGSSKSNKKCSQDDEAGGELLGGDDIQESLYKKRRSIYSGNYDDAFDNNNNRYNRRKRSHFLRKPDFYEQYASNNDYGAYDEARGDRLKRRSAENDGELYEQEARNSLLPLKSRSVRFRRRISDVEEGRPQQLSDMSDLDLFGALPKSYEGELSRFKRVKRKYTNKNNVL